MKRKNKSNKKYIIVSVIVLLALIAGGIFGYPFVMKKLYPKEFQSEISAAAVEFGVEEDLVYSIVLCESSFQPDAVSPVGAVGLMQLMPSTAEWVAEKLNEEYSEESLKTPTVNLRYGCWYLNYLSGKFEDISSVIAAYNAGPGKVESWLTDAQYSSDGVTLTNIPYSETAAYVKRVMNAYEKYNELYQ